MSAALRVALITGAGSGIGRAVALAFLADGYRVVLAGRRPTALQEVLAAAGDAGRDGLAVACDVTEASSVQAVFAKTQDEFGRLDMLFNNAGIGAPAMPIEELTVAHMAAMVA